MAVSPAHIAAFRAFNRFHTHLIGALDRHLLDSPYSLTESRILYEIARREAPTRPTSPRVCGSTPLT